MPALLRRVSKHVKDFGLSRGFDPAIGRNFCHQSADEQGASGLEFARKISRSAPRPSESDLRELTAAGYSQLEIAEIAYLASLNAGGNRLATLLAVPPSPLEEIDANWFAKLKRPFTRKEFRAALSYVVNVPYPAEFVGPGAGIVRALEGSPAGAALATVLERGMEFHDYFKAG